MLLYGPPGTGKTLLARAVAGEAGVPFFSISGSDFVEMFVGVGASRVRDLFEQAKQNSPCIIFMDEIDAVGRHRGAGMGGGHDEREQTLNQLLVEMDGFEMKDNIILIAATNRPDILDPALLRPGRFDRQIVVDRPDRAGREQILKVHSQAASRSRRRSTSRRSPARRPGFTGADLANLVNEAALLDRPPRQEDDHDDRARRGHHARDRRAGEEDAPALRAGAADHRLPRDGPRAGRALPAQLRPRPQDLDHLARPGARLHDLDAVARTSSSTTRPRCMDTLAMTLGGRAAEELVFDEVTTGAANDLEKVTRTAKNMIMRYGMSEKLGPRTLGHRHDQPFLGREFGHEADYSQEIAREIDDEIRRIIEDAHDRARQVLAEHVEELHRISKILLERETIDRQQFLRLLDGATEEDVWPAVEEPTPRAADRRAPPGDQAARARPAAALPAPARHARPRRPDRPRPRLIHRRPRRDRGAWNPLAPCRATPSSCARPSGIRRPSASSTGGTPGRCTAGSCGASNGPRAT